MAIVNLYKQQIEFLLSAYAIAMFIAGRGTGKTYVAAETVVKLLTEGYDILACSPTYKQLKQVLFKDIVEALAKHGIQYKVNWSEMRIEALGQVIYGSSGESFENARGYTVGALVVDEAAMCKLDAIHIWMACCRGHQFPLYRFISTPRGKSNWMYDYHLRDDCFTVFAKMEDNPFISEVFKQQMRDFYGDTDFARQELDGDFVSFNAGFFPVDQIIMVDNFQASHICQSFDLAFTDKKNSDYTANGLAGMDYEGYFGMLYAERWKFKAPETKGIIIERTSQIDCPALIEINGGGRVIYDDLVSDARMSKAHLIPVNNSSSKTARGLGLSGAMANGMVKMKKASWNQMVIDEMAEFSFDDSHMNDDLSDTFVMDYNHLKYGKASGAMVYGI